MQAYTEVILRTFISWPLVRPITWFHLVIVQVCFYVTSGSLGAIKHLPFPSIATNMSISCQSVYLISYYRLQIQSPLGLDEAKYMQLPCIRLKTIYLQMYFQKFRFSPFRHIGIFFDCKAHCTQCTVLICDYISFTNKLLALS